MLINLCLSLMKDQSVKNFANIGSSIRGQHGAITIGETFFHQKTWFLSLTSNISGAQTYSKNTILGIDFKNHCQEF